MQVLLPHWPHPHSGLFMPSDCPRVLPQRLPLHVLLPVHHTASYLIHQAFTPSWSTPRTSCGHPSGQSAPTRDLSHRIGPLPPSCMAPRCLRCLGLSSWVDVCPAHRPESFGDKTAASLLLFPVRPYATRAAAPLATGKTLSLLGTAFQI